MYNQQREGVIIGYEVGITTEGDFVADEWVTVDEGAFMGLDEWRASYADATQFRYAPITEKHLSSIRWKCMRVMFISGFPGTIISLDPNLKMSSDGVVVFVASGARDAPTSLVWRLHFQNGLLASKTSSTKYEGG